MIPEYGHFALILALFLAVLLSIVPLAGTITGRALWMNSGRPLALGYFIFTLISYIILTRAFLVDDFSVAYVANHSNSLLPYYYKVTAVWGGHEGSVLLWALVLAGWTIAVAFMSRQLPPEMLARVLSVMGIIGVGFLLFILATSNPFDRLLPNPVQEGQDLNPLLQDFGMIIHPPMLYMGYVGFSVCFAFAIAALLGGRLDSSWARWSRPWTNMAWSFQTLGIMLGSWWAYYELGWGGWWFWDPVENASFLPWLVGTALIHSLAVSEKRGVFKSWTILLAIFAFSLSLLGTFIVRSGVLTSVHAFAVDPTRGMFILGFLGFVVGGSLLLYALRVPQIRSTHGFTFFSRETFLLLNNILFVVATAVVMFGTLYPLLVDAVWGQKMSVGPPWFDMFFAPIMILVAILVGIGSMLNWKRTNMSKLYQWLLAPLAGSILLGLSFPWLGSEFSWGVALSVTLGSWVILSAISDLLRKVRNSSNLWRGLRKVSLSYYGMMLAHIGFAICLLGASITTLTTEERDVRMVYGESVNVGGFDFVLTEVVPRRGPNYDSQMGEVQISKGGKHVTTLYPEKRHYFSDRANVMTQAGIDPGFTRDLFVALGVELDNRAWSMRISHFPFVRWIWLGAIFMGLGGFIAILDKRYRLKRTVEKPQTVKAAVAATESVTA